MRHITYLAYLLASFVGPGALLTMQSGNELHVLSAGDSIVLDCDFHADDYNLFDYPVLWRKSQAGERTQVNIMGNINEPYMASNRFEVAFTSTPPRFRLELTVVDLSADDSGNYTCEVRGPQSVVLGRITHYVFVKMPVRRVVISDDNFASDQSTTPASIHLVDGRPSTLRCVAFGGYPPPKVELYVGRRDITDAFEFASNVSLTGRRGLRQIVYRSERWTYGYLPDADDDQAPLKCLATVSGEKSYIETVLLSIDYAPKISCTPAAAYIGDLNVAVRCAVLAKPPVTAVFWIIDANGTFVSQGDPIVDHWTMESMTSDGVVESTLFIRLMTADMFRRYSLVAENSVSVSTHDVIITQKKVAPQLREAGVPGMAGDDVKSKQRVTSYDSKPSGFFASSSASSTALPFLLYVTCITHACQLFHLRLASVL